MVTPIRQKLKINLPDDLVRLFNIFDKAGKEFYLAGGAVRDALLGKEPKDFDIATNTTPNEVEKILSSYSEYKVIGVGKAFGISVVVTPEGNQYELAMYRKDIGKGRRPDRVEFTTIDQEVQRRDLTMNSLFYDIKNQEVVDYVGGIEDIKNGIVRASGNPADRFEEDPLRILRAMRFAGRFGSSIETKTSEAIKANNNLTGVSPERVRDEFLKGIKSAKSTVHFFGLVEEHGLWEQVFPGLEVSKDYKELKNTVAQVALLLRTNQPEVVQKQLNKLKYTSDEVQQVTFLLYFKNLSIDSAYALKKRAIAIRIDPNTIKEFARHTNISQPLVDAFISYQPTVAAASIPGITGKELGMAIAAKEKEIFLKMISEVRLLQEVVRQVVSEYYQLPGL